MCSLGPFAGGIPNQEMGLPYEAIRELDPRIVAVSMTGVGESSPYRDHPAYGSLIDALSGT